MNARAAAPKHEMNRFPPWVRRGMNNRRARFYRLTRAGKKQLGVEEKAWSRLSVAIGKVLRTA